MYLLLNFFDGCCVCLHVCVYHMCTQYLQRPEEDIELTGTALIGIGSCCVGVGNQTWVLWKRSQCSELLSHVSGFKEKLTIIRFPRKLKNDSVQLVSTEITVDFFCVLHFPQFSSLNINSINSVTHLQKLNTQLCLKVYAMNEGHTQINEHFSVFLCCFYHI